MRNIYISQTVQSEQDLYENIIIESADVLAARKRECTDQFLSTCATSL